MSSVLGRNRPITTKYALKRPKLPLKRPNKYFFLTLPSLNNWLTHWSFVKISSKHRISQTVKARELKLWENVHHPSHVTYHDSCLAWHVSHVTWHHYFQTVRASDLKFEDNVHHLLCVRCHMSPVMCHMSRVPCPITCVTNIYIYIFVWTIYEARQWRVCYQRGLPRLVIYYIWTHVR